MIIAVNKRDSSVSRVYFVPKFISKAKVNYYEKSSCNYKTGDGSVSLIITKQKV